MMSLMQLLPMPPAEIASGRVTFQGQDLVRLDASAIRQVRGARIGELRDFDPAALAVLA